MRKIVILWIMFFSIFSFIFADENVIEFENIYFSWQLFTCQKNNMDFAALNPMFFNSGNKYFSINYFEDFNQNNRSQNTQNISTDYEVNIFSILGSIAFISGIIYAGSSMNRQEREVYNNIWEQQLREEKMYREIFFDNNRNIYGN
jgi:hypothetical protein